MIQLGLFGASGRMGERVRAAIAGPFADRVALACAVDGASPPEQTFAGCDAVVDFSVAAATDGLLARLAGTGAALITGTTGRGADAEAAIARYAAEAPVFAAANFSVGVAVLSALVTQAARALGPAFAAEIFELHHGRKVDAPSGTALALGAAVAEGRGLPWPAARAAARDGLTGPRAEAEIGFAALRGGDVVGEHTVFLLGDVERLELTHRAADRAVFAHGALRAATWVVGQPPGRYGMADWVRAAADGGGQTVAV